MIQNFKFRIGMKTGEENDYMKTKNFMTLNKV